MASKKMDCTCQNKFQDEVNGYGRRVFNKTAKDEWRCTVCGSTKSSGAATPKQSSAKAAPKADAKEKTKAK